MKTKDIVKQKELIVEAAREEARRWECPKCHNRADKSEPIDIRLAGDERSGLYCRVCYGSWLADQLKDSKLERKTIIT
jgi:hypothetical protein